MSAGRQRLEETELEFNQGWKDSPGHGCPDNGHCRSELICYISHFQLNSRRTYARLSQAFLLPADPRAVPLTHVIDEARNREQGSAISMATDRRRLFGKAPGQDYVFTNLDITARKGKGLASHQLSARLLKLQDEERRKFARELHDSAGQLVASLTMNTDQLSRMQELNSEQKRLIADNAAILRILSKELGTISHLLHPPLLDEVGLSSALQWYVDGFAKRSDIATTLELDSDFGRLNADAETAIFRIVQECLTNVHRHSGSRTARVRLHRSSTEVRLEVQDEGKGIPAEKRMSVLGLGRVGVGLRGMRERVRQLGGKLEVRSQRGTTVTTILPIDNARGAAA